MRRNGDKLHLQSNSMEPISRGTKKVVAICNLSYHASLTYPELSLVPHCHTYGASLPPLPHSTLATDKISAHFETHPYTYRKTHIPLFFLMVQNLIVEIRILFAQILG